MQADSVQALLAAVARTLCNSQVNQPQARKFAHIAAVSVSLSVAVCVCV